MNVQLRFAGVLFALGLLPACLGSMVGYPCADGYTECGEVCVDLTTSSANCGACGNVCSGVCARGACDPAAGSGGTAGGAGAGGDAGADASGTGGVGGDGGAAGDAGSDGAAGNPDAQGGGPDQAGGSGAADGGPGTAGADGGASDAVDGANPTDGSPANDVPVIFDAALSDSPTADVAVDLAGETSPPVVVPPLVCAGPLVPCGGVCIPVDNDADNCGSCGNQCGSGICAAGICNAQGSGHLVLIGHDYTVNRSGFNNLVGNAVLLTNSSPASVLVYEGAASAASISGADQAINQVSLSRNRPWTRATVSAADLPTRLPGYDTLLIHAQRGASNAALMQLGQDWTMALNDFVASGGTLVVLDGVSPNNDGTYQILVSAGLSVATGHTAVTGENLTVIGPGDAVAIRVPKIYRAETTSVSFTTMEATQIVRAMSGEPVVLHRTF